METIDPPNPRRYVRQSILPQVGADGQRRLAAATVLIVGCGALGNAAAEQLARAGVGTMHLIDRDLVEITNLQRQVLFDESDAHNGLPKAVAAANRLGRINSSIRLIPHVMDLDSANAESLGRADLVIDGTDNVDTRYLLNDLAVKRGMPWIYGACVGAEGRVLAMRLPGDACLRCVFPQPPDGADLPTCDTAGVLGPAAAVVGALQAAGALRLILQTPASRQEMLSFDLWSGRFHSMSLQGAKRSDCPTCGLRRFEFLEAAVPRRPTRLCGRNAVQLWLSRGGLDLDSLATKLRSAVADVRRNEHALRMSVDGGIDLTVFRDGRVIVHGTGDASRARALYDRYIGS